MTDFRIGVGSADISDRALEYVTQVLKSKRLSYGPFLKKFEAGFAKIHGSSFGLTANSGTDALRVAVSALKELNNWKDGDEVLVPAVTFIASSNVVIQNNLVPVFVDVDPKTYNMDPAKIEERITGKTRAIMPVHLFGQPCDMTSIMKISKKHGLKVIEDSCETMFVSHRGKPVGSFGDFGCFSTYVAHLLVTGVGGVITCSDKDLALTARSLLNHGRDSIYISIDDDDNVSKEQLSLIMERRFNFVRIGYSSRLTELEGALGLSQLEMKDEIIKKRQKNAEYLTGGLSKFGDRIQLPYTLPGNEHSYMLFPIVITDKNIDRHNLTFFLEKNGIETRFMFPLLSQPVYVKLFGDLEGQYPVAKWINSNGFYIGCHQALTKQDLDYIVLKFTEFFNSNPK
ncbi:DegT/DnrJ/EryC1/StrS family aminotransferase [Candidatus Micrarchaeota archaeon]|nr:DegT/DnrJ/EryC1/StrS family aminotransferase [Candidatus Micrarchaeota archaeon]